MMSLASIDARSILVGLGSNIFKPLVRLTTVAITLTWNGFSALATVYDSDGSSTNVQFIHDTLVQNGDTITIPAGTALAKSGDSPAIRSWSEMLSGSPAL